MPCLSCGSPNDDGAARCGECGEPPRPPGLPFLSQGTLLYDSAYAIGTCVGVGRFGLTYTATMRGTMQPVIIKELVLQGCVRVGVTLVPRGGWNEDHLDDARQRFLHEGQALARLDHPNLAPIEGTFEESNTAYVVMEHLRGRSLARLLQQRGGKLKEADAVEYVLKAGEALEAAHRIGILHGDVKPRNVFLVDPVHAREGSRVILVDFCTAGRLAGGNGQGRLASSPGYSPPECYPQQVQPGPYTDVYALAAVLYHCLTGRRPPEAPARTKGQALAGVRQVNPWIHARVAQAVMRGLETESWRRPQTVAEFLDELRFGKGGVSVPPTPPTDRPGKSSLPGSAPAAAPLPPPARVPPGSPPRDAPTAPPFRSPRGTPGAGPLEQPDREPWPPPLAPRSLAEPGVPRVAGFAPLIYSVRTPATKADAPGRGARVSAVVGKKGMSDPPSSPPLPGQGASGIGNPSAGPARQPVASRGGRVRAPAAWAPPVPLVSVVRIPVRRASLSRRQSPSDHAGGPRESQASEPAPGSHPVANLANRRRRTLAWALTALLALGVWAVMARSPRLPESGRGDPPAPGASSMATSSWAAHRQALTVLAFSSDGRRLLSGGQDHTARLWEIDGRQELHAFQVAGSVTGIAFSPDGSRIATASTDESVRIWTTQGRQVARIRVGSQPAGIAFSDDGTSLAGRGATPLLCVWSATTGQPLSSIEIPGPPGAVRFAEGNTRLVSTDLPNFAVRISDLASGTSRVAFHYARPQIPAQAPSRLPRACLSDNGRIALTRGSTQDPEDWLIAWDILEGKAIGRGQVRDLEGVLAVSPRGRMALLTMGSRTVAWDVIKGEEIFRFAEPSSTVTCGAFSSDGRRFAVGGSDGRIHVGSL